MREGIKYLKDEIEILCESLLHLHDENKLLRARIASLERVRAAAEAMFDAHHLPVDHVRDGNLAWNLATALKEAER